MDKGKKTKRLFFGFHLDAPWPLQLPKGRIIASHFRHMTLAFLGEMPFDQIEPLFAQFPKPTFSIGPTGIFDRVIFLPKHFARVVAWHMQWMEDAEVMESFQKTLALWLHEKNLLPPGKERPFLPHATICRKPFSRSVWARHFSSIPFMVTGFHLYESLGDLQYSSLWEYPLLLPFEEIPHTADLAFKIRGKDFSDLYLHAQIALLFTFPKLTPTICKKEPFSSLEEVIARLNKWISYVDQTMGSPIKAISYHGDAILCTDSVRAHTFLEWEMIVDV